MNLLKYVVVLIQTIFTIATAPPIDIVFFIQNQDNKYENKLSCKLKESIMKQSIELQPNYTIKVHLLDEIFNYPGGWTIHNLIPQLLQLQRKQTIDTYPQKPMDMEIINDNTRWIVFCEGKTKVKVKLLMERLNNENHTQPLYLGHSLYDREPTIIHHFAFFENPQWFPYPLLRAGVIFTMPLFKSIAEIYAKQNNKHFKQQFSIDAGHELAQFIYDNVQPSATTVTTTKQNSARKNQNNNICHHASMDATSNEEKTTSSQTTFITDCTQAPVKIKHASTLTHAQGTSNVVSHVPHSTSTNKISGKHEDEISNPLSNTSCSTAAEMPFIKKRKIILKKASYICPAASWEARSRSSKINKNNFEDESCAMYAEAMTNAASIICTPIEPNEIYFAVKTCSKYHNERLPIIHATWAPYATHIKYFSDLQDDTIPTSNTGVPNVDVGHCDKTLKILRLALKDIETYNRKQQKMYRGKQGKHDEYHQIQWLFLSDDDTILSVSGVCQVLGCYNSMDAIYLGERYGYRLYEQNGFNYITGGGGIAFSLPVVELILQHCSCPSPTAPDDMILGSCLHSLQLKTLHSSRFHQARPNDYPWELLQQERPVSFHKFWQHDPIEVYNRWFALQDRQLFVKKNFDMNVAKLQEHHLKSHHKFLTKSEPFSFSKVPVSMMTSSLPHSKERHVDL